MQARSDKVTVPSITMAVTGASGDRTLVIALSAKEISEFCGPGHW